jgi:hypothetical protein
MFPSHLIISVFDESANWIDSLYVNKFWTQDDINKILEKTSKEYSIDKWVASEERKILERSKILEEK